MLSVSLYGFLADKYGKHHAIEANTPAEVLRAFIANYKDFKKDVIRDGNQFYKVIVGNENRSDVEMLQMGTSKHIKIIPVISGRGGLGRILVGAALIFVAPQFSTSTLFSIGSQAFSISSMVSSLGWSLVLGGVSQMLFSPPKPKINIGEKPENIPSYTFSGAVNVTGQGNPVPICYGRMRVGSQVISTGLSVAQL